METGTRLYLVRHGETEWNKQFKYQGHKDIPLSEIGREQATKIANRLKDEEIDQIITSDLSRAMETAKPLADMKGIQIQLMPEFKETNFGKWEGLTFSEINQMYPEIMANWQTNPLETTLPDGESLTDVLNRVKKGMQQLIEKYQGKKILLVSHGGVIRILLAHALQMDIPNYWRIRQDNVALNIIDYYSPERIIVSLVNDINHV